MKNHRAFSAARFWAILVKEFIQMRRDRLTFGMMIGIPLLQLILFGYAINSDPKHLPAAVLLADDGPQGRTLLYAMRNSGYFDFVGQVENESAGRAALARGEVQFVVNIPQNFTRDLLRGDRPAVLVEADATDPAATSNALGAMALLLNGALQNDLKGPLAFLAGTDGPIDLRIHALYNPEAVTQYNIVPGLLGVVLTMTMVMITALAITRERERGTMENLLSMPTRPVGGARRKDHALHPRRLHPGGADPRLRRASSSTCRWSAACAAAGGGVRLHRRQPRHGHHLLHRGPATSSRPCRARASSSCRRILLSGFMFPFRGMPRWAQAIGEFLPLTHFLRIVRGILLKGNGLAEVAGEIWPIALFTVVAFAVAVMRYRQTLD